ncbi:hypothetical protein OHC33_003125 [Knufia fluminis]|uniref:DUF4604 domain-containing protein n=1 Tax=Knufia fluminis TaxID=191047 RepID=A0AAN8EWZ5_9EURO|nr:hypothetical protein OHC33_003125 [Knufia fluminis]
MPKKPALEYSAAEPAFLRRIKAGKAALDGRHNVQIPRARGNAGKGGRLDMGGDEGEDDPVMLDESGNVVTKEEIEAKDDKTEGASALEGNGDVTEGVQAEEERKIKDVEGGVSSGFAKKRKAVKVIGDDEAAELLNGNQGGVDEHTKSLKESTKDLKDVVTTQKDDAKKEAAASSSTKKGKRKKLKLSFDDDD